MYTTISTTTESYSDSKYTVADILSSMANGHVPVSLPYSTDPLPPYTSGIASTPTSILTPSTLANIEQTFIDLQSAQVSTPSQSGGFVPPLIDPVPSTSMVGQGGDYTDFYPDESSSDPEWTPGNSPKRSKLDDGGYGTTLAYATSTTPQRKTPGPRRRKNEQLTPEEERRREVRRERNKLAAAKCRQRRVDLTNRLLNESDGLEDERSGLETEIQSLQQQKEQLEFLLQAHKPVCNAKHIKQEKSNMAAPCATIQGPLRIPTPASSARPNSLALPITTSASAVRGGVFTLGLDSLADGHTGLTPLMGTPLMCTPTTVPTCSAAHRTSSDSSPSDTMASPTTLMAL